MRRNQYAKDTIPVRYGDRNLDSKEIVVTRKLRFRDIIVQRVQTPLSTNNKRDIPAGTKIERMRIQLAWLARPPAVIKYYLLAAGSAATIKTSA